MSFCFHYEIGVFCGVHCAKLQRSTEQKHCSLPMQEIKYSENMHAHLRCQLIYSYLKHGRHISYEDISV